MDSATGSDSFGATEAFRLATGGDVEDPYPSFARMRRKSPVHTVKATPLTVGKRSAPIFTLFTHDLVDRVLRDHETFSSRVYGPAMGPVMGRTIIEMDPPEHSVHRGLVNWAFRKRALAQWEADYIVPKTEALVDGFLADGRAELMSQLIVPYPVQIIAGILGLPPDDYSQFLRWAMDIISWAADIETGKAASEGLTDYLRPILEDRRSNPRHDLVSDLATAEIDGHRLTDEEIFGFLRLLLPAGAETTARAFGNLMTGLLTNPDQLDAVREDRSLVRTAIEETLRWECPLLFISREATADTELEGVEIPEGSNVSLCLGSANRDEKHFDHPDEFDVHRQIPQHMAFGTGIHMCLGQQLARIEMTVMLDALLDRCRNLRVDPDREPPEIRGLVFRSPQTVNVVFDPG